MHYRTTRMLTLFGAAAAAIAVSACSAGSAVGNLPGGASHPNSPVSVPLVSATPTPTPIPLVKGGTIGNIVFPDGDTATGGQGQVVDGESCIGPIETVPYHHHIHVALFVNDIQYAMPRALGFVAPWKVMSNGFAYAPKCKYYMHSHDATGVIHLEYLSVPATAPTLGEVFDVWGEPLTSTDVAGYNGSVTVFVNGVLYPYNIRNLKVGMNHMQITLEVNSNVPPPVYDWTTY